MSPIQRMLLSLCLLLGLTQIVSTQAFAYQILDIEGRDVSAFLRSDHTIVIGFDGNSEAQLKTLIKQAVSELASEVDQASYDAGFVPLEGFHILFVFDSRASIRRSFESKTGKYDGIGLGKGLARRIVERRAPGEVSEGTRDINPTLRKTVMQEIKGYMHPKDVRIVSLFDNEWSINHSEGRVSTGRRIFLRTRHSGATSIGFSQNGPSGKFMNYLFGSTSPGLAATIIGPTGNREAMWRSNIPPMDVIEKYANLKGIDNPSAANSPDGKTIADIGIDPFDALIKLSVEFTYPDLGESVKKMKTYMGKLDKCVSKRDFTSSTYLRDFFYKAFVRIYTEVQALNVAMANHNYIYLMKNRQPLLDFVDMSTVMLRLYYSNQSEKFVGGLSGLSPADQELQLTLRAVYEQVASMLKLEAKEFMTSEQEWQGRELADYENDPYWSIIIAAIEAVESDSAYCGAIL